MSRHFTVSEANGHLRIISPVLRDAVRLKREHDGKIRRLGGLQPGPEAESLTADVEAIGAKIRERIEFITALGIQIKDIDHGLVDFPTMRDGEEVLLCWYLDEPSVGYWHSYDKGFPGRQPV